MSAEYLNETSALGMARSVDYLYQALVTAGFTSEFAKEFVLKFYEGAGKA